MSKEFLVQLLTYGGLPCIAKYILDFVIDYVSPKWQQLVAPTVGGIIGGAYGAYTSNFDPAATGEGIKNGIVIGVATIAAHKALPDVIKQQPDPAAPKK